MAFNTLITNNSNTTSNQCIHWIDDVKNLIGNDMNTQKISQENNKGETAANSMDRGHRGP